MNKFELSIPIKISDSSVYLLSSLLTTFFLFYIDEGYYSFKWMTNVGSWIVFLVYGMGLFLAQLIISMLISQQFSVRRKRILSIVLGLPIGIGLFFLLFFGSIGK